MNEVTLARSRSDVSPDPESALRDSSTNSDAIYSANRRRWGSSLHKWLNEFNKILFLQKFHDMTFMSYENTLPLYIGHEKLDVSASRQRVNVTILFLYKL